MVVVVVVVVVDVAVEDVFGTIELFLLYDDVESERPSPLKLLLDACISVDVSSMLTDDSIFFKLFKIIFNKKI